MEGYIPSLKAIPSATGKGCGADPWQPFNPDMPGTGVAKASIKEGWLANCRVGLSSNRCTVNPEVGEYGSSDVDGKGHLIHDYG
ncbi:MAG: hypothetical protein Q7T05_08380 [Dehalococcoidia bacterium]|nr:hypothetical protein [Dehalococcoidia bacterium]